MIKKIIKWIQIFTVIQDGQENPLQNTVATKNPIINDSVDTHLIANNNGLSK